jgi:hypothetical protein
VTRVAGRLLPGVLCLLLLGGCLDFETVTAPVQQPRPALVSVFAAVRPEGDGSRALFVSISIHPGWDAQGARAVVNDTLRVGGRVVLPERNAPGGGLEYRSHGPVGGADAIRIELPRIERVTNLPPSVTWSIAARVGPDTLRLRLGEDLLLRVAAPAVARPDGAVGGWNLSIQGDGGAVGVQRFGPVPESIVVPASLLAAGDGAGRGTTLAVTLATFETHQFRSPSNDLEFAAQFRDDIRWTVERTEGAGGP